jgi:hypothetical protein
MNADYAIRADFYGRYRTRLKKYRAGLQQIIAAAEKLSADFPEFQLSASDILDDASRS